MNRPSVARGSLLAPISISGRLHAWRVRGQYHPSAIHNGETHAGLVQEVGRRYYRRRYVRPYYSYRPYYGYGYGYRPYYRPYGYYGYGYWRPGISFGFSF